MTNPFFFLSFLPKDNNAEYGHLERTVFPENIHFKILWYTMKEKQSYGRVM